MSGEDVATFTDCAADVSCAADCVLDAMLFRGVVIAVAVVVLSPCSDGVVMGVSVAADSAVNVAGAGLLHSAMELDGTASD